MTDPTRTCTVNLVRVIVRVCVVFRIGELLAWKKGDESSRVLYSILWVDLVTVGVFG